MEMFSYAYEEGFEKIFFFWFCMKNHTSKGVLDLKKKYALIHMTV
jgi:hypothetical protein